MKKILLIATAITAMTIQPSQAAPIIFDDFNVNEGKFTGAPTASGSTIGILATSTADRITTAPVEGTGCERLVFNTNNAASIRVRFLSGGGTPANNTAFTTSAGTDGWIGCYLKTTNSGWNAQIWIEGGPAGQPPTVTNNASIIKDIIADGAWHLYEWDLDNTAGDADGWGASLVGGSATVPDGNHTIDSIIFRNTTPIEYPNNTIFMDYIAKTDSGSVANLLLDPCVATSGVLVIGPVGTNSNQIIVSGVSASATTINVYQNSGAGMVVIGTKTTGITAGNNTVTVAGLVKGDIAAATQTVTGQESCVPATGVIVGGGANPRIRAVVSIRETTDTGPVGAPATTTSSTAIHFLGTSANAGGSPGGGTVLLPNNSWQTATFQRGTNEVIGDSASAAGALANGSGYALNDTVSLQVHAYRTLPNGVTIYSATAATSSDVTSNDVFTVNWTWSAVPGAQGYRILRSLNFGGYLESVDVPSNNYSDANTGWTPEINVTPTTAQSGRSVQWNPTASNTNNLPGQWGILESINFVIDDLSDTGPYDLYIDNLKNGNTTWQTFEGAVSGTVDVSFRAPSFSSLTSGSLLSAPDQAVVSNLAADAGTKSYRVQFQWSGTNATKWLRLTTSGVGNPLVNLDDEISFRILLVPVGSTPVAPPAPTITINQVGANQVLNWTDAHRLQASSDVTGTYTNVPGVITSPWINTFTEPQKFFRLRD